MLVRARASSPFERLPHPSASVLVLDGSVAELSAAESLENNESDVEVSVSVDSWLGGRSTVDGEPVRGLEGG